MHCLSCQNLVQGCARLYLVCKDVNEIQLRSNYSEAIVPYRECAVSRLENWENWAQPGYRKIKSSKELKTVVVASHWASRYFKRSTLALAPLATWLWSPVCVLASFLLQSSELRERAPSHQQVNCPTTLCPGLNHLSLEACCLVFSVSHLKS